MSEYPEITTGSVAARENRVAMQAGKSSSDKISGPCPICGFLHEARHCARLNDSTVSVMLKMGKPLEDIIGELVAEKGKYLRRIMELESIAPRKIVLPDGRVMVWRCPDAFVPELPNENVRVVSAPRGYKRVAALMDDIHRQFMDGASTKRLCRKHSLPQETVESVLRMKMFGRT